MTRAYPSPEKVCEETRTTDSIPSTVQAGSVTLTLPLPGLDQCDSGKHLQGYVLSKGSFSWSFRSLWECGPVWPGLPIFPENLYTQLPCRVS